MDKRISIGGIALIVAAIAVGGLARVGWDAVAPASAQIADAAAGPSEPATQSEGLTTVTLRVDGMWCASCSYIVEQALLRTEGVVDASVSGRAGTALVTFDRAIADIGDLIDVTGSYGFPSELLPG